MKLKPGNFYVSQDGFVWCCFKVNANARKHQNDSALCVRVLDCIIDFFYLDGRYDCSLPGRHDKKGYSLVKVANEKTEPKTKKKKAKKKTVVLDLDRGKRNAKYFGSECQANPGSSFLEYKDDIAVYYGHSCWDDMPKNLKTEALAAFNDGKREEKKLNG